MRNRSTSSDLKRRLTARAPHDSRPARAPDDPARAAADSAHAEGAGPRRLSPRGTRCALLLGLASLAGLLAVPPELFAQQAPVSATATAAPSGAASASPPANASASRALKRSVDELQDWVTQGKGQLSLSVLDLKSG